MRASTSKKPITLLRNIWNIIIVSDSRMSLQSKPLGLLAGLTVVYLVFDLTSTILLDDLAYNSIPGRSQSVKVLYIPSGAVSGREIHVETVW